MNWLRLFKKSPEYNHSNRVVVFAKPEMPLENVRRSNFYSVHICPKCKHILDHDKARYQTECCYLCGYSNSKVLFDLEKVVVCDLYVNDVFTQTICKSFIQ